MLFKSKRKWLKKIDTNVIKEKINIWSTDQNIKIEMFEILFGDYRDGTEDIIDVFCFFKNYEQLKVYEKNGYLDDLKMKTLSLFAYDNNQAIQIDFTFDIISNRRLYFITLEEIRKKYRKFY